MQLHKGTLPVGNAASVLSHAARPQSDRGIAGSVTSVTTFVRPASISSF